MVCGVSWFVAFQRLQRLNVAAFRLAWIESRLEILSQALIEEEFDMGVLTSESSQDLGLERVIDRKLARVRPNLEKKAKCCASIGIPYTCLHDAKDLHLQCLTFRPPCIQQRGIRLTSPFLFLLSLSYSFFSFPSSP